MTDAVNLTPTRVAVLKLIAERNGYNVGGLAEAVAPRGTAGGWTQQGATRWGAGFVAPLVQAGLVKLDLRARSGYAMAYITEKGRQAIAQDGGAKP